MKYCKEHINGEAGCGLQPYQSNRTSGRGDNIVMVINMWAAFMSAMYLNTHHANSWVNLVVVAGFYVLVVKVNEKMKE